MSGVFGNLLGALADIWKNIGIGQKVSIILITLVSAGIIGGILYFGSRPDWRILYSDLDSKTAAKVCDIIRDNNVPMNITNGGRTIMVPSKDVYAMRMKVAGEGVAVDAKGSGFELFDNMQLGLTDRQQQIAYQRAIQGELSRMIAEMPGIVDSKVMVTMPRKSIFKKDENRPTASIMLVMNRGSALSPDQINSIRYMVASAVPEMTPNDVTITDNRGRLLQRQTGADGAAGSDPGSRLELSRSIENDLKEKAEAILRPIVGAERVVAMVSCDIDFEKIDRVIESINTEQTAVISEKIVSDDAQRSGASRGNAPGAAANAAPREQVVAVNNPDAAAGQNRTLVEQRKTVERQYVIPKSMEKVSISGGRVKRLSVAVTVGYNDGDKPWSDEQMNSFERLIAAAVGVDNYILDKSIKPVTVRQMPFAKPQAVSSNAVPMTDQILLQIEKLSNSGLIRPVAGMLILMILFGVFKKYFNRGSVETSDIGAGFNDELYTEELSGGGNPAIGGAGNTAKALESASDALQNKVKATPEAIAEFMESWMAQG